MYCTIAQSFSAYSLFIIASLISESGSEDESQASPPHEFPLHIWEQMGIDPLQRGIATTSQSAATMVNAKASTLQHRRLGHRTREEESQRRQKLTPEEERFLVERCEHLGKCGFPVTVEEVREHALHIYQQRVPDGILGKNWVKDSFYHRHAEVKSKFSKQLDYRRRLCGNNKELLSDYFDTVCCRPSSI